MSRIFLSHSSIDEREALALKHWLVDNGLNGFPDERHKWCGVRAMLHFSAPSNELVGLKIVRKTHPTIAVRNMRTIRWGRMATYRRENPRDCPYFFTVVKFRRLNALVPKDLHPNALNAADGGTYRGRFYWAQPPPSGIVVSIAAWTPNEPPKPCESGIWASTWSSGKE